MYYPEAASVEPEDPLAEKVKKLEEEIQELKKNQMKEILMPKGILSNTADQKPKDIVINIEEN